MFLSRKQKTDRKIEKYVKYLPDKDADETFNEYWERIEKYIDNAIDSEDIGFSQKEPKVCSICGDYTFQYKSEYQGFFEEKGAVYKIICKECWEMMLQKDSIEGYKKNSGESHDRYINIIIPK